jgi:hypothetical protein
MHLFSQKKMAFLATPLAHLSLSSPLVCNERTREADGALSFLGAEGAAVPAHESGAEGPRRTTNDDTILSRVVLLCPPPSSTLCCPSLSTCHGLLLVFFPHFSLFPHPPLFLPPRRCGFLFFVCRRLLKYSSPACGICTGALSLSVGRGTNDCSDGVMPSICHPRLRSLPTPPAPTPLSLSEAPGARVSTPAPESDIPCSPPSPPSCSILPRCRPAHLVPLQVGGLPRRSGSLVVGTSEGERPIDLDEGPRGMKRDSAPRRPFWGALVNSNSNTAQKQQNNKTKTKKQKTQQKFVRVGISPREGRDGRTMLLRARPCVQLGPLYRFS